MKNNNFIFYFNTHFIFIIEKFYTHETKNHDRNFIYFFIVLAGTSFTFDDDDVEIIIFFGFCTIQNMFHAFTQSHRAKLNKWSNNKTLFFPKNYYYYDVQQFLFAIHFLIHITQNNILFNTSFGVKSCDEYRFLYFNTIVRLFYIMSYIFYFYSILCFCDLYIFDKTLFL